MKSTFMKHDHIVQYPDAYSHCIGCSSCELFCALAHDGVTGPCHGGIKLELGRLDQLKHTVYVCEHCEDHPCYEACPKKDKAMCVDENGTVYINEDECIGCGLCAKKCPVGAISGEKKQPYTIDPNVCIRCGQCIHSCRKGAVTVE